MPRRLSPLILCLMLLVGCNALSPANPSPTPVAIVKELATAYISPTPNPEEAAATRAASSPTPLPPSPTVIPTETPYIGIFVGEAERPEGFVRFSEPLFGGAAASAPTANANVCVTPIDRPYLPAWRNNPLVSQRLGCPIQGQPGFGFFGEAQVFENGVMYYYPALNAVWAIIAPRTPGFAGGGRFEYLENPPEASTVGLQAPSGLQVPGDVFGDMWLAVEGLRGEIGFALTEAQEIPMGLQRFANGSFLLDGSSEQVFALVVDGTVLGPFLAPQDVQPGAVTPTPAATLSPTPAEQ